MKIKKLILYTGGIETLMYFSLRLGEAFEKLGYEIFYYDLRDEAGCIKKLKRFIRPGETVSVGFNFNGCSGEDHLYDKNDKHLFDELGVPMVNIVVDHPFYYHKFLPYLPHDYMQISIDKEHEDYIKRFFPEIKRGPFLPLAGSTICEEGKLLGWDERPVDVIFTGNYNPPEKHEPLIKRNGPEYEKFYRDLLDDIITNTDLTMSCAIEKHIKESFPDEVNEESLKDTFPYMIMIDLYIRHYFRAEAVKALVDGGVKVDVYGAGWECLSVKHPENLIIHPATDSLTCLKKTCEAKVSLNVMPWFKHGAHDRVFSSMLNGAVCVTDKSSYLTSELAGDKEVIFYDLAKLHELPDKVNDILSDREKWHAVQTDAYKKAIASHTWEQRAIFIHKEILSKY